MRNLKLASASLLLVLGGGLTIACGDSGDDGADGGGVGASNTGGGATTGGAGNTGGGATTGGAGTGGGATGCDSTTKATGTPTMIDDFNTTPETPGMIPENDGRAGQWAHGHFLSPAGGLPEFVSDGGGEGGGPGYMQITCEAGNADDYPQCNTAWDSANPWAQWAAVSTLLQTYSDPLSCYDVDGVFTGIRFKAKSTSGMDKIRIQIATPDANPDTGETYQSPEIDLGIEYGEVKQVPFATIEQPSWSTVSAPLNLKALQSISFVVRTVSAQEDGTIVGEKLEPYQIQIDDIEFY